MTKTPMPSICVTFETTRAKESEFSVSGATNGCVSFAIMDPKILSMLVTIVMLTIKIFVPLLHVKGMLKVKL